MSPNARRALVAFLLAMLVFAAGACLTDAAGHHGDAAAQHYVAVVALAAVPVALALDRAGRMAPAAAGALPALALDLVAPPPEA